MTQEFDFSGDRFLYADRLPRRRIEVVVYEYQNFALLPCVAQTQLNASPCRPQSAHHQASLSAPLLNANDRQQKYVIGDRPEKDRSGKSLDHLDALSDLLTDYQFADFHAARYQ